MDPSASLQTLGAKSVCPTRTTAHQKHVSCGSRGRPDDALRLVADTPALGEGCLGGAYEAAKFGVQQDACFCNAVVRVGQAESAGRRRRAPAWTARRQR